MIITKNNELIRYNYFCNDKKIINKDNIKFIWYKGQILQHKATKNLFRINGATKQKNTDLVEIKSIAFNKNLEYSEKYKNIHSFKNEQAQIALSTILNEYEPVEVDALGNIKKI